MPALEQRHASARSFASSRTGNHPGVAKIADQSLSGSRWVAGQGAWCLVPAFSGVLSVRAFTVADAGQNPCVDGFFHRKARTASAEYWRSNLGTTEQGIKYRSARPSGRCTRMPPGVTRDPLSTTAANRLVMPSNAATTLQCGRSSAVGPMSAMGRKRSADTRYFRPRLRPTSMNQISSWRNFGRSLSSQSWNRSIPGRLRSNASTSNGIDSRGRGLSADAPCAPNAFPTWTNFRVRIPTSATRGAVFPLVLNSRTHLCWNPTFSPVQSHSHNLST